MLRLLSAIVERREILIAVTFLGYKTDFNLGNITAPMSFYLFGKKFTSKCHQSADCYLKSCSFDRRDSAKPEKIFILLLSGMAVAYEHSVTIKLRQTKRHGGRFDAFLSA